MISNLGLLVDVSIIDSKHIKDSKLPLRNEIWGVGGIGRKSKLSQFRFGYTATKKSNTYENFVKPLAYGNYWSMNLITCYVHYHLRQYCWKFKQVQKMHLWKYQMHI